MITTSPTLDNQAIEQAAAAGRTKLNLGGGLQLRLHKNGLKYFQFRLSFNGKDTTAQIGKYPEMTLLQAREKSEQYRREVEVARTKRAEANFRKKLREQEKEQDATIPIGFKGMEDAGRFLQNIQAHYAHNEFSKALWFLMHIPCRADALFSARWGDFDIQNGLWRIVHRQSNPHTPQSSTKGVIYLSHQTANALNELRPSQSTNELYLFPGYARLPRLKRDLEIADSMKQAWPHYLVRPDELRLFFKEMALKNSYFRLELIEDAAIGKQKRKNINISSYILQRHALADWWSNELSLTASHSVI